MNLPNPLAHVAIHDTVENILRDAPRGRRLDVPAGEGALAKRLIEIGFDVPAAILSAIFKLEGAKTSKAI